MQRGNDLSWWSADRGAIRIFREALAQEDGQDLVEYAILIALISLAATVSMNGVAASISNAFTIMSGHISTYTS